MTSSRGVWQRWRKMMEGVWKPRIYDDVICERSLTNTINCNQLTFLWLKCNFIRGSRFLSQLGSVLELRVPPSNRLELHKEPAIWGIHKWLKRCDWCCLACAMVFKTSMTLICDYWKGTLRVPMSMLPKEPYGWHRAIMQWRLKNYGALEERFFVKSGRVQETNVTSEK